MLVLNIGKQMRMLFKHSCVYFYHTQMIEAFAFAFANARMVHTMVAHIRHTHYTTPHFLVHGVHIYKCTYATQDMKNINGLVMTT